MAAEERRKKREQMKILKQQVRIFFACIVSFSVQSFITIFSCSILLHIQILCAPRWKGFKHNWIALKFHKKVAILPNAASSSSAYTHCTSSSHTPLPPPLYNMHDLTVNSFDLALILLPGEDQAHSANSYGERTPCTANSRGSSWKLLQKHSKTLPFCCWWDF